MNCIKLCRETFPIADIYRNLKRLAIFSHRWLWNRLSIVFLRAFKCQAVWKWLQVSADEVSAVKTEQKIERIDDIFVFHIVILKLIAVHFRDKSQMHSSSIFSRVILWKLKFQLSLCSARRNNWEPKENDSSSSSDDASVADQRLPAATSTYAAAAKHRQPAESAAVSALLWLKINPVWRCKFFSRQRRIMRARPQTYDQISKHSHTQPWRRWRQRPVEFRGISQKSSLAKICK